MQKCSVFRPPKLKIILLLLPCFFILWFAGTAQVAIASPATPAPGSGNAFPVDQWVKGQVNNLPTDKVESYWDQLMKDYGGFFQTGQHHHLWTCCFQGIRDSAYKVYYPGFLDLCGMRCCTTEGCWSRLSWSVCSA